jgi:hypothetical protein
MNSQAMYAAYLVGKPYTPATTFSHPEHWQYAPKPGAEGGDVTMDQAAQPDDDRMSQKRGADNLEQEKRKR